MAQIPEDVSLYLRALRRRIIELEQTAPQQRIAKLEAVNRGLQVQLEEALALVAQQQEQLGLLQQQLADTTAKLNTNSYVGPAPARRATGRRTSCWCRGGPRRATRW